MGTVRLSPGLEAGHFRERPSEGRQTLDTQPGLEGVSEKHPEDESRKSEKAASAQPGFSLRFWRLMKEEAEPFIGCPLGRGRPRHRKTAGAADEMRFQRLSALPQGWHRAASGRGGK